MPSVDSSSTIPGAADDLDGLLSAVRAHQDLSEEYRRANQIPFGGFPFPPESPTVWVKYDISYQAMERQATIQSFVYEQLKDVLGIRVPKVLRVYVGPLISNS